MRLNREYIDAIQGSSIACLEFDMPEFDHGYHYHPEVELTWIVESDGERLVGDSIQPFGPGDLVLIGSNVPHRFRNWQRARSVSRVIQFRPDLFGTGLPELEEFAAIGNLLGEAARGVTFSKAIREEALVAMAALFDMENRTRRLIRFMELLNLLAGDDGRIQLASTFYSEPVQPRKVARLERILNYLEERWTEPVTLNDVARVAALHPQSLSRFFRQHLGVNFQEYLIQLRLTRAARLLLSTEATVVSIAFQCGFNNLGNFNKHFRQHYRISPSQYRNRMADAPVAS